jgi:hypothetical protein
VAQHKQAGRQAGDKPSSVDDKLGVSCTLETGNGFVKKL